MKKIITFSILILGFLFAQCRKEKSIVSTEPTPTHQYRNYTGKIFGTVGDDTLYADSAFLLIDHSMAFYSNSIGQYSIDSVLVGMHQLSISHGYFYQLDTTIEFADSPQLSFRLTPSVSDYLPLRIGNHWTYTYNFSSGYMVTGQSYDKVGTFTWTITSALNTSTGKKYEVKEQFYFAQISNQGSPSMTIDTTYGQSSGSFFFVEDNKHRITIESGTGSVTVLNLAEDLSRFVFVRFNPTVNKINISIPSTNYPFTSYATKGIGIYYYASNTYAGGNYYHDYSVTLFSYLLVQ
jgi:hypothetical protein